MTPGPVLVLIVACITSAVLALVVPFAPCGVEPRVRRTTLGIALIAGLVGGVGLVLARDVIADGTARVDRVMIGATCAATAWRGRLW